jgi:type II secretory ATPase GspE/PulE/Tfp pilus assembly ATPase PilB-like protein
MAERTGEVRGVGEPRPMRGHRDGSPVHQLARGALHAEPPDVWPQRHPQRFHGRTGIYELVTLDEAMRAELRADQATSDLRSLAVQGGMRTLRADGLRLVRAGITTPEEVLRVTRA